jgi:hypothetical protein
MEWPFKTIKQKSEWPFHGILIPIAAVVLQAPPKLRTAVAQKQIERCLRMGAKLAVEFGMCPWAFLQIAEEQIVREGGEEVAKHLAEHKSDHAQAVVDGVSGAEKTMDDLLAMLAVGEGEGEKPN